MSVKVPALQICASGYGVSLEVPGAGLYLVTTVPVLTSVFLVSITPTKGTGAGWAKAFLPDVRMAGIFTQQEGRGVCCMSIFAAVLRLYLEQPAQGG